MSREFRTSMIAAALVLATSSVSWGQGATRPAAALPEAAPASSAAAPATASPAGDSANPATKKPAATRRPAAIDPASVEPKVKTAPAGKNTRALDRLELDTTQITGNRELPKVMVVVPWKKSDIGDLVGRPVNSLVDEALQPVDREVFRREVDYYGALAPDRPASGPSAGPSSGPSAGTASRSETGVTPDAPVPRPEK